MKTPFLLLAALLPFIAFAQTTVTIPGQTVPISVPILSQPITVPQDAAIPALGARVTALEAAVKALQAAPVPTPPASAPETDPPPVVVPPVVTPSTGSIPTPTSISGKPLSGRIVAKSNQVIENLHITTTHGECILVPSGVTNVTIRNNEIGPCGSTSRDLSDEGVRISANAGNVTVKGNVIHDMSSGLKADAGSLHPIVFSHNYVYNIRGPFWQGQMIQLATRAWAPGVTGSTRITCNVADGTYGNPERIANRSNEDHISLYDTIGSQQYPIEIAYNRIRGYTDGRGGKSGTGMQLGDSPAGGGGTGYQQSGWYWVHHNTIVHTNGAGIAVAGGSNHVIEDNRVDNRSPSASVAASSWAFSLQSFAPISGVVYKRNRGIATGWAWDGGRALTTNLVLPVNGNPITNVTYGSGTDANNFGDASLNTSMFDAAYSQCE